MSALGAKRKMAGDNKRPSASLDEATQRPSKFPNAADLSVQWLSLATPKNTSSIPIKARVVHHMPVSFMKARQNDLPEQSAGLHPAMGIRCSGERIRRSNDRLQLVANPRQHLFPEPADHRSFF